MPDHDRPLRVGSIQLAGLSARFVRGTSWNLVGTGFNQGSTFLVNAILANLWGLQTFGEFAVVLSTVSSVVHVSQLAAGYTATRYVAQYRAADPERAGRILGLCAAVSSITGAIASAVLLLSASWLASVVGQPGLAVALRVAALVVFPNVINGFMMGALAGLEGYPALGKSGIVSGLAYVVLCTAGGWAWGVTGAFIGLTASAVLQAAVLRRALAFEAARHHIRLRWSGGGQETHVLRRFAIPAALNGMLYLPAIWLTNGLLVTQSNGYEQIAIFTAANSFRIIALFVPNIIGNVGMSLLNNQRGADDERRYRRVFVTNLVATAAIVVVGAGAMAAAGPWLLAMFGPGFRSGYSVMLVLLGAAVLETAALSALHPIQSQDRVWLVFGAAILPCYATLIAVAIVLVPTWGALGLAWAYVSGWSVALVASGCLIARLGVWRSGDDRSLANA